jgi:hypothetical protein
MIVIRIQFGLVKSVKMKNIASILTIIMTAMLAASGCAPQPSSVGSSTPVATPGVAATSGGVVNIPATLTPVTPTADGQTVATPTVSASGAAASGAFAITPEPPTDTPVDSIVGGPTVLTVTVGSGGAESSGGTVLTPEPPTDTPVDTTAGGPTVVTLDDQGKTIQLAVGQSFLLKLGETFDWTVNISDQTVISRVRNIMVVRGAQGVYDALKAGTVMLTATGDPPCRQSHPPCAAPSLLFEVTIVVK